MHQSIALIGLPGVGKSTIGKILAGKIGVDFVDTDAVIEQQIGQTIRAYFSEHGESVFRMLEKQTLQQLFNSDTHRIIATGGGSVLDQENRQLMRDKAIVVYLESTVEQLALRLQADQKRPLLIGDVYARLEELHQQREVLYKEAADFSVNVSLHSAEETAQLIIEQFGLASL